jgi:phage shock protein PspC (stress-responsive transcriptional regulator)
MGTPPTGRTPPHPPAVSAPGRPPRLYRVPAEGYAGGVCAGLARYFGVDALPVRVVFAALAAFGGAGVALYVLAWALVPAGGPSGPPGAAALRDHRAVVGSLRGGGGWRAAAGIGLLVLAGLLLLRQVGLWPGDFVVWPVVLGSSGLALIARQAWGAGGRRLTPARERTRWAGGADRPAASTAPTTPASPPAVPSPAALSSAGQAAPSSSAVPSPAASSPADQADEDRGSVPGGLLGAALVVIAALIFLEATGTFAALRRAAVGIVVVVAVIALVFGPWMVRQARALATERAERIRSQERAEVAAHLHDSVLQTLALIQRRAEDPRTVGTLARRQERELRQWLSGVSPAAPTDSLGAGLTAVAHEIEGLHGVEVEVVTVGDAPLDARLAALVQAAREALANAARFSGAARIDLYAEVTETEVHVFVRDRGAGFDPAAVPEDRRGVRESIVGRMERHRGHARVDSQPGEGTEVELSMGRASG